MVTKVYLSRTDRKVAGVLGGIGEAYNTDPMTLRLLWVFIAIVTGFLAAIIVYILAWAVLPEKPTHKIKDDAWTVE